MSPSELTSPLPSRTIGTLTAAIEERFIALVSDEVRETLDIGDLRTLVSVATRLYAFAVDDSQEQPAPVNDSVSPTEALVLAGALLRVHGLNPFDLAAWLGRTPA